MSAGTSSARRIATLLKSATYESAVCRSCQHTLSRRGYATEAVTSGSTGPTEPSPPSPPTDTPSTSSPVTNLKQKYTIEGGIVLSRSPRITRDLTPFEKSFFLYQRRLNERLALPFTRYFYFKQGTPADVEWKRKYKDRQTAARDIGNYNAYSQDAWNDELLVGAKESEPEYQVEALVQDAEGITVTETGEVIKKEEIPRPLSRVTEADRTDDQKSLDRLLQRTIYLLVRVGEEGYWKFPSVEVQEKESIQMTAERALFESAGPNMNHWMVGYHPVGHYNYNFRRPKIDNDAGIHNLGTKTFFLKGRIMAGQADVTANTRGITDFKWLAKEEIQKVVLPGYWASVRNILADR
ncbi:hypothetical protein AJ80_02195 [Polytolypa hystricis UAMH7299]|uniref:Large ribosomal subunit protein mL46 n=1 Tax=Polytolypa hystricis (strain UAMH7299) TaxID=1447883 RepID=A0A2B7YR17_POLH7|nr:hypothetical protein AJ80_02195 [Polytolypa hystricis UAMH7299]